MSGPGPGLVKCPYCQGPAECDSVDIGIGFQQCGPYLCSVCGASEIGFGDTQSCTPTEARLGWYGPGRPVSQQANTYQGRPVSHQVAKALYRIGLLDPKPTL